MMFATVPRMRFSADLRLYQLAERSRNVVTSDVARCTRIRAAIDTR